MIRRLWAVWLIALFCLGACRGAAGELQPAPTVPAPTAPPTTGVPTTVSMESPPGVEIVTGTSADGFAEVEAALAAAVAKWEATRPEMYGYRVTIEDGGAERRVSWVRVFEPDWPEVVSWDVEQRHAWVAGAVDGSPDRIEVAFDPELGIPEWFSVEGERSESTLVDELHEIVLAPSPFDGSWRLVEGEIDGREFTNPSTGLIWVVLENGHISFPIDCNDAHGAVDIHNGYFGVGLIGMTAVGCGEYSEEAELFTEALEAATTIEERGPELVLAGENSVLRLVPLSQPELRGELPRTAAGETLPIEGGSVFTISAEWARHPGSSVLYLLTAAEPGSSEPPTWRPWEGEVEVPPAPAGSVEVVMPDDIAVGDYRLCSPYWTDNFFCHDLLVRPPSAPWYVTAGPDGVILHDADGTSEPVWHEPTSIAFWFEDMLLLEATDGSVAAVPHSGTRFEVAPAGSRLLDAAVVAGSPATLVVRDGRTVLIDVESGDETDLGLEVIEGRIADGSAVLRTAPTRVEARSIADGSARWELDVDSDEMISLSSSTELRLDGGRLADDGSFMQYLDTRLVDIASTDVIAGFSTELAVPLEGDEMTEMCVRAELRDSLMLCSQPDGRFLTVQVARTPDEFGGDQLSIPGLSYVTGTYVRSEP